MPIFYHALHDTARKQPQGIVDALEATQKLMDYASDKTLAAWVYRLADELMDIIKLHDSNGTIMDSACSLLWSASPLACAEVPHA